jgi:hypothetical protein
LLTKENKLPFSVSVFRLQQTKEIANGSCRFSVISLFCIHIYIKIAASLSLYIYAAISNGIKSPGNFS